MTRLPEPLDRVRELGDASVPSPLDVQMMTSCDDAPTLENAMHRRLNELRVNRVNFRKEFFRVRSRAEQTAKLDTAARLKDACQL